MRAAAHTHRQAGWQIGQFGSVQLASFWSGVKEKQGFQEDGLSQSSLGGVGVTGVQAGLCGCRGAAVMASRWAVEGLSAPPQVLQGLQEGATCPLLLQGWGAFFFYLCYLSKGDRLCFEASLTRSAGAALAPCRALGDRQLLGELLHSWSHKVSRQDVEASGLHNHLTHCSHGRTGAQWNEIKFKIKFNSRRKKSWKSGIFFSSETVSDFSCLTLSGDLSFLMRNLCFRRNKARVHPKVRPNKRSTNLQVQAHWQLPVLKK